MLRTMRTNLILLLSTMSIFISILFIPLQVIELGGDRLIAGVTVAVYSLMSLVSLYVFGWMSDTRGRMNLIKVGMFLSALTFLLQIAADSIWTLFLIRAICGLSVGIFYSSLIIYGIESGKQLGKYTSFESLGTALGTLIAGIVAVYAKIFLLSSVFFFIGFLLALRLPQIQSEKIKTPLFPYKIIRKNIKVYLPFLMRDIGAHSIWALFPIYLAGLGASMFWMGAMISINTGLQFFFKRFIDKVGHKKLFYAGMLLSCITFFSYILPSSYLQVIPIQVVLAFSWSFLHVGTIGLLTTANVEKASVIGLFASARSFAQVAGPLIAGVLTYYYGFNALMLFAGTLTLAGLAYMLLSDRRG